MTTAAGGAMNAPEQPEVTKKRGGSSTEYRIVGSLPAVLKAISKIFDDKHPMGYGTYVHAISMENDGRYAARVSHANSAD